MLRVQDLWSSRVSDREQKAVLDECSLEEGMMTYSTYLVQGCINGDGLGLLRKPASPKSCSIVKFAVAAEPRFMLSNERVCLHECSFH